MICRHVLWPARWLPYLEAILDKGLARIKAGEVPDFIADDSLPELLLTLTIERPEPVAKLKVG